MYDRNSFVILTEKENDSTEMDRISVLQKEQQKMPDSLSSGSSKVASKIFELVPHTLSVTVGVFLLHQKPKFAESN